MYMVATSHGLESKRGRGDRTTDIKIYRLHHPRNVSHSSISQIELKPKPGRLDIKLNNV